MSTPNIIETSPFDVAYLQGSPETLQIGRLSIRKLYTWTRLLSEDRLPDLVALTVGKPIEWVDTLTDESFAALSTKCIALNFRRAMEMGKTDPTIAVKLGPLLAQFVAALRASPFAGKILSAPLPAPASSGSPAATGSESSTSPRADSSPSSPSTPA